jgi:uncharacterized protein
MAPPLRERLTWDGASGAVHDGPRRYLMMRPDVLMGALHGVDAATRGTMLDALAASTQLHGSQSLRAYAEQVGGDAEALMAATTAAAADLGWGRWTLRHEGLGLQLEVDHSPFVAGWCAVSSAAAPQPVCAPIRGMFGGLASIVLGAAVQAEECACAAQGAPRCRFTARRPG